jgi:ketosteroid isomerase-like protein
MGNADAAKDAYGAFSKGDLETLREGFAEDAEWQTSDELPLGGVTRGRDAIMESFAQIPNYWSSFSVEPAEFIDCGDKVVVRGTQRATGEGGSFEAPFLHLMEYRDGKVVRGEFHGDSAKALNALGTTARSAAT